MLPGTAAEMRDGLRDALRDTLRDRLRDRLCNTLRETLRETHWSCAGYALAMRRELRGN